MRFISFDFSLLYLKFLNFLSFSLQFFENIWKISQLSLFSTVFFSFLLLLFPRLTISLWISPLIPFERNPINLNISSDRITIDTHKSLSSKSVNVKIKEYRDNEKTEVSRTFCHKIFYGNFTSINSIFYDLGNFYRIW